MEHHDTKMTRREKIHIGFLILLAVFIGTLFFAVVSLVKYAEEIRSDPVQYAISKGLLDSCICFKEGKGIVNYGDSLSFSIEEEKQKERTEEIKSLNITPME